MTGNPQYTAAQILQMGQRAELEGSVDHAAQFYAYIVEHMRTSPEAADAKTALQRLAQLKQRPAKESNQRLSLDISARPIKTQNAAAQYNNPESPVPRAEPSLSPTTGPPKRRYAEASGAPAGVASPPPQQMQPAPQPAHAPPANVGHDADNALPRVTRREDEMEEYADFAPGYRFSRFLAFMLLLVGWLAILGGLAFAGMAVAGVVGSQLVPEYGGLPFGVAVGIGAVLAGLLLVFVASLARAAFEAANNTRELLEIERAKSGW